MDTNNENNYESVFSKWRASSYAKQYLDRERQYLKSALRQVSGPRVLQLGSVIDSDIIADIDFPQLIIADTQIEHTKTSSLVLDPAFLPIREDMVSTIIVPHVLERHELPHQVLREVHRVLTPEGHIILTGFNPISMMGLQRLIFKRAVCPGSYFTANRVSDWLQLLGFEIVASSTFQYSPLINGSRVRKLFNFLNPLGDRWLPMMGGGYMITARKKQVSGSIVGRFEFTRPSVKKSRRKLATASSHSKRTTSINSVSNK